VVIIIKHVVSPTVEVGITTYHHTSHSIITHNISMFVVFLYLFTLSNLFNVQYSRRRPFNSGTFRFSRGSRRVGGSFRSANAFQNRRGSAKRYGMRGSYNYAMKRDEDKCVLLFSLFVNFCIGRITGESSAT
jgi:hypothetical protein